MPSALALPSNPRPGSFLYTILITALPAAALKDAPGEVTTSIFSILSAEVLRRMSIAASCPITGLRPSIHISAFFPPTTETFSRLTVTSGAYPNMVYAFTAAATSAGGE